MECKNCGNKFDGKFCNQCGQNIRVDKLTLRNFMEEVSDSVFQVNHGLLFTIKSMFVRPGHTIREFLNGKRKEHFKPIAFALTLSTVYFLVSQLSNSPTLIDDFLSGYSNAGEDSNFTADKSPIINWLSNNYAYTTLLLIPIFSLASYIAFLGLDRNYLENIVINSYITGQQAIFYVVFMIIGVLVAKEDLTVSFALLVSVAFNFWTFIQFYNQENKGIVIVRLILTYFLFYILFSIISFVILFLSQKF